jgi:hypothetical protein
MFRCVYGWGVFLDTFTKSHERFWKQILDRGPESVAAGTGVGFDKKKNTFMVKVLGDDFLADPRGMSIESAAPGKRDAGFEIKLVIVTYLALGGGTALSGEWVSERALTSGSFFFRGLHALPGEKIIDSYGGNTAGLKDACKRLGGREIQCGALFGMEFLLLPKFPVRMLYWEKDEEFPARISFLFDRNADRFLYLDGILALMNMFAKRITIKE